MAHVGVEPVGSGWPSRGIEAIHGGRISGTEGKKLLDAGQPVAIELELVDPGKQAIAYEFNFL